MLGASVILYLYCAPLKAFIPICLSAPAPIALGIGAGADARRPLGLAVVGGLLFSQFLTLYLTPVFYTYIESFQAQFRRNKRKLSKPQAVDVAIANRR